jgi:hypothetical protein
MDALCVVCLKPAPPNLLIRTGGGCDYPVCADHHKAVCAYIDWFDATEAGWAGPDHGSLLARPLPWTDEPAVTVAQAVAAAAKWTQDATQILTATEAYWRGA